MTLYQMLKETASKHPNRIAVISGKKKMNYRQLLDYVDRLGLSLSRLGLKKQDKAGLLLENCPEFILSYFAIISLGAVVVPLNTLLKTEELKFILEDAEVKFLFSSSHFKEEVLNLRLRLDKLEKVIIVDKKIEDLIYLDDLMREPKFDTTPGEDINPEDLAAILYTSGTTGRPKGAMLTHSNFFSNVSVCAKAIEANHRDNFICILPMFHSFSSTVCILLPISVGAAITVVDSPRPFDKVIKAVIKNRVSIFVAVPSIYNILAATHIPKIFLLPIIRKIFNPLRLCISGAAALPVETLKNFEAKFKIPLVEGYGLTETSPVVSLNPMRGPRVAGSIGLPLENVQVKVMDDAGKILGPNQVGELLVKGPNVMKGYFNLPQETEEFLKDDWLYTGDLAKIDQAGYIYIVDRKKDMVNVRGLKVYPREVEEILYRNPNIAEAAVIGVKDVHHGEVPVAYVSLKEGRAATEQELIHFCREHLASFKVPRRVEFRDSLPKTATGKIFKRGLK